MAKKSKEVRDPIYQGGRDLGELVVVAPKINTKAKKGTWEYVKAVAKNRKQTAYTRDPYAKVRSSDIVVTDSNGQASYFTDPVDGKLIRRGQYTYRSNAKDNSLASGLQNFLNTTTAGAMDLASYVPYVAGHALNKLGSPVGKDLIQTSKDLELDARRLNRYEVAPADFLSASTLGSLLPSLGLAAVTGGKSLALDANTSRAFTKHITKDLGGSPLLSNILGNVAGAATLMPIGGATLQGATKQALTEYLKSAATRAALNTGIGVGTVAAPQLFTGDYEGALNTATTIAPIIAGSSIVASGLPKAAAYKGYAAITGKYLKNLYASDDVWAADRQKLPWYIPKKWADRARGLNEDINESFSSTRTGIHGASYTGFNARRGGLDAPDLIPYSNLSEHGTLPTAAIIPEIFNLAEGQYADRIYRYVDPTNLIARDRLLQEAVQQSQRLTGKRIDVKNVPQAQGEYRSTAVKDALLRKILKSIYDADNPEEGTIGHSLKQLNQSEYDSLMLGAVPFSESIGQDVYISNPMLRGGLLYNHINPSVGVSFRHLYPYSMHGLKDHGIREALDRERKFGILFNKRDWDLRQPSEGAFTEYTLNDVLDLISNRADRIRQNIGEVPETTRRPYIEKFVEEYNKRKLKREPSLKLHKIKDVETPQQAHELFEGGLPEYILDKIGLNIKGVEPGNIPLHTRAVNGEAVIDDMIENGVIRSRYGAPRITDNNSRSGAVFMHNKSEGTLSPGSLYEGTAPKNSTPITQDTSPDFDFRAGRTSHYVAFDGRRDGGLGGSIVAVVNPDALGGEYYQIGKPHETGFHDGVYTASSLLSKKGGEGEFIPSESTFEHITKGIKDYKDIADYLGHIVGSSRRSPSILTTHRTFGKTLKANQLRTLRALGVDTRPFSKRPGRSTTPVVPIAPPIEAISLFEYVNPQRKIYYDYARNAIDNLIDLEFDIDYAVGLRDPNSDPGQLHNAIQKANTEKSKNDILFQQLEKMTRINNDDKGALYLLPYSEMQKFVEMMSRHDKDYGFVRRTINGTKHITSKQF